MLKNSTTEQFIEKAKKVHGDLYDYSLVEYVNTQVKVEIICKIHGVFIQRVSNHFRGSGCKKCAMKNRFNKKTKTLEQFIIRAKEVHGDEFDYSKVEYVNASDKVIVTCSKHGDFLQRPYVHLRNHKCRECTITTRNKDKTKSQETFLEEVEEVHGDLYDYSNTIYLNTKTPIIINCKIHGDFEQTPRSHLRGADCPYCNPKNNFYTRSWYIKQANGKICTFYTLRCFNEEEEFYKVGITMNTTKERYSTPYKMPYSYEIISEVFGEAGVIWDIEKAEIKKLKEFHYIPKITFGGHLKECFTRYNLPK